MDPKGFAICRFCGERIYLWVMNEKPQAMGGTHKPKWAVLNPDLSRHSCPRGAVKIYSEEEKREFARRRAAGEV